MVGSLSRPTFAREFLSMTKILRTFALSLMAVVLTAAPADARVVRVEILSRCVRISRIHALWLDVDRAGRTRCS